MLISNNFPSTDNLTQGEDSKDLYGSNKELNRVLLGVSLQKVNVVFWLLESVKTKSLEGLQNRLKLRTSRRCEAFLDVNLLCKFNNNLRPENGLGNKS